MTTKPILPRQKQRKPTQGIQQGEVKCQEPIIPMSKVSLDVIKKLQTQPYPQLTLATHSTISDALELYYNEYVRLFKQNQFLNDELASILLQRNNLADQFNQIKKMKSYDDNIRRRRRYASQIERNYHCPMPKCNKGYGSEGSLTHHVRLKHPKFFESGQYQIYLETYILPKQEIKNQDGKGMIDVEDVQNINKRLAGKKNKIEIKDDDDAVKQAKQQDQTNLLSNISKTINNSNKKPNDSSKDQQKHLHSVHLNNSIMREVDGYIVLEEHFQESKTAKLRQQKTKVNQDNNQSQKVNLHNNEPQNQTK